MTPEDQEEIQFYINKILNARKMSQIQEKIKRDIEQSQMRATVYTSFEFWVIVLIFAVFCFFFGYLLGGV